MLIYSELTGKLNNLARNRFLLSEPKIVTKIGIFFTDLLPGTLLKQKYFVTHTLQKSVVLSLELSLVYIRKLFIVGVS